MPSLRSQVIKALGSSIRKVGEQEGQEVFTDKSGAFFTIDENGFVRYIGYKEAGE